MCSAPQELRDEADARRRAGIRATYLMPRRAREKFGVNRDGAILSHGNLALDPRKLTAGLLLKAAERGARFLRAGGGDRHQGQPGTRLRSRPRTVQPSRPAMSCWRPATSWPTSCRPRSTGSSRPGRSPRGRSRAGSGRNEALIWEASDPYLYLRATRDGRVICGGEDEEFTDEERRDGLIAAKSATLAAKLARLFPGLDTTPEFAWAGSFGTTHRPALYRQSAAPSAHPCGDGLWRQRYHLFADCLGARDIGDRRSGRQRRWSFRLQRLVRVNGRR